METTQTYYICIYRCDDCQRWIKETDEALIKEFAKLFRIEDECQVSLVCNECKEICCGLNICDCQ